MRSREPYTHPLGGRDKRAKTIEMSNAIAQNIKGYMRRLPYKYIGYYERY